MVEASRASVRAVGSGGCAALWVSWPNTHPEEEGVSCVGVGLHGLKEPLAARLEQVSADDRS